MSDGDNSDIRAEPIPDEPDEADALGPPEQPEARSARTDDETLSQSDDTEPDPDESSPASSAPHETSDQESPVVEGSEDQASDEDISEEVQPPTEFEQRLSDEIDAQFGGGSGTVWRGAQRILADELGLEFDEVGAISVTDNGVIYNRPLSAGLINSPRKFLVVPVADQVGVESEVDAVKSLIPKTRHLTTIGIASKDAETGVWRVRKIVDVEDVGIGDQLIEHFPAAQRVPVPLVPVTRTLPTTAATPVDELDVAKLVQDFESFLQNRQLIFTDLEQIDLLAAALSSQFVLFAGPSGTGKSTAADALATFLSARSETIEIPRGLQRQAELLGYYSTYGGRYVESPHTSKLLNLGDDGSGTSPFAIIEEANLSPFEGYFSAALHGLSRVVMPTIDFPLHGENKPVRTVDGRNVPATLRVGPYPRFLGTINVDHTAPAPAKKVAGRACVVLLEPPSLDMALQALSAPTPPTGTLHGAGAHAVGDPSRALKHFEGTSNTQPLFDGFRGVIGLLIGDKALGSNRLTPRDARRAGSYLAWFRLLATTRGMTDDRSCRLASENALLHFVLPGLSGEDFAEALRILHESPGLLTDGLLRIRVDRLLAAATADAFGPPPDFWTALS